MRAKWGWLLLFVLPFAVRGIDTGPHALVWDAFEKSYAAKPGEEEAAFTFIATNKSDHPVRIVRTATSCHCTAAVQPRDPWIIEPGASDELRVLVDLRSRRGGLTKTIYVETSDGEDMLLVHVQVPPPPAVQREMNMMMAQADRQAVLRGDCATCHVAPTVGKKGAELFATACLICHAAAHRATMVPDLMKPATARDAAFWQKWIREGGEGTMMPAFAKAHGGPLDDGQIESLVEYLVTNLPTEPVKDGATAGGEER
jgi:mono/diheme cytochrome c family protein